MLWLKAFHIVFVIAWFAGLFYLPRLFVYHAETHDEPGHARFVIMERRLFILMTIAGLGTVTTGLWIALSWWQPFPNWLWLKLALVSALLVHHALCWRYLKAFAARTNTHSHRYFRVFNEVPTLILVGVILLVELQPMFWVAPT